MDIADSLHSEDFTNRDFFDFVSGPDDLHDGQRNICYGAFTSGSDMDTTLDDLKEANNNNIVSNGDCMQLEQMWGTPALDKDVLKEEKVDYVFLEEYLTSVPAVIDDNKTKNTDGPIPTVTILNPDNSWGVLKSEDEHLDGHRSDTATYVPTSIQLAIDTSTIPSGNVSQSPLELESMFHIIMTVPQMTNGLDHTGSVKDIFSELNGHQNGDEHLNGDSPHFQYATLTNSTYTSPETPTTVDSLTTASSSSTIVLHPSPAQSDSSSSQSPILEQNRGWIVSTPSESLLRSALQGKSQFQQQKETLSSSNTSPQQNNVDSNSELRRALSAPPGNNAQYPVSPATSSPYSSFNGNSKDILLNGNGSSDSLYPTDDSPTPLMPSTTIDQSGPLPSMDELILTHLDSFTGDYEKLRRIEKEVAESTKQFCNGITTTITTGTNGATMYLHEMPTADLNQNVYLQGPADVTVLLSSPTPPAIQPTATVTIGTPSSNAKNKKYSRRQNGKASPAAATTTGSLNGIRKERSLHYCTICNKGFKDKYSVNVHIRTHTGEKPFSCSLCGKNFRQKAHLAKHFQTHSQKAGSQPKTIKR